MIASLCAAEYVPLLSFCRRIVVASDNICTLKGHFYLLCYCIANEPKPFDIVYLLHSEPLRAIMILSTGEQDKIKKQKHTCDPQEK